MSAISYPSSPNHRAPPRAATSSQRRQVYASPTSSFSPQQPPLSYSRPRTFTGSEVSRQQQEEAIVEFVVVSEPAPPPPPSPPRVRQRSRSTTTRPRATSPPPPPPPLPPPLPLKKTGLGASTSNGSSSESSFETAKSFQSPRKAPLPPPPPSSSVTNTSTAIKRRSRSNSYAPPPAHDHSNHHSVEAVPPLPTPSPLLRQEHWRSPVPERLLVEKDVWVGELWDGGSGRRGSAGSERSNRVGGGREVARSPLLKQEGPFSRVGMGSPSSPRTTARSPLLRQREEELEKIARDFGLGPADDDEEEQQQQQEDVRFVSQSRTAPPPPPERLPSSTRALSHRKPPPSPIQQQSPFAQDHSFPVQPPSTPQAKPPRSPQPTPTFSSPKPFVYATTSPASSSPPPGRPPRSAARRPSVSSGSNPTAMSPPPPPPPPIPALPQSASPRPSPRIGKMRRPTISYPAPSSNNTLEPPPPLPVIVPQTSSPASRPLPAVPTSTPGLPESTSDSLFTFFGARPESDQAVVASTNGGRSRSNSVAKPVKVDMRKLPNPPPPQSTASHYSTTSARQQIRIPPPALPHQWSSSSPAASKAPSPRPIETIPAPSPRQVDLASPTSTHDDYSQPVVLDPELIDALTMGGANGRVHRRSWRRPESLRASPLFPAKASPVINQEVEEVPELPTARPIKEKGTGYVGERASVLRRMSALKGLVGGLGLGFDFSEESGGSAGEGGAMVGDDDEGRVVLGGVVEEEEEEEHHGRMEEEVEDTPTSSPFLVDSSNVAPPSPAFNFDLISRGLSKDRRSALYVAFEGTGNEDDEDDDAEVIRFGEEGSPGKLERVDEAPMEGGGYAVTSEDRSSWPAASETTDVGDEAFFSAIGSSVDGSSSATGQEESRQWESTVPHPIPEVTPIVIDAALKASRRRSRTQTLTRSSIIAPASPSFTDPFSDGSTPVPSRYTPSSPSFRPTPPPLPVTPIQPLQSFRANLTLDPRQPNQLPPPPSSTRQARTWRESLPPVVFEDLLDHYGSVEMKRQEVIWELCLTEEVFVSSMQSVLRLFARPLRTPQGLWIEGIPMEITRLFDWLYDIVQLHTDLSEALIDLRKVQSPLVESLAEVVHPFAKRLDVHQPYLVKLEGVTNMIERLVRDPKSDFGEFVRMQTESPECGSMSLASHLLKAAQRLMKYPLFFKQLCHLTSSNHPDHLPTLSLLHSTDSLIRVMEEVKAREEEYETIKSVESRMRGLPDGFQLASRKRRLLGQGILHRVHFTGKESSSSDHHHSTHTSPLHPPPSSPNLSKLLPITLTHSPQSSSPNHRTSQGSLPDRPGSTASDSGVSCYSDASSSYSDFNPTSFSSTFTLPSSPRRSTLNRQDSVSSSCPSSVDAHNSGYPSHWVPSLPAGGGGGVGDKGAAGGLHRSRSSKTKETAVHVFVFSDLVLLASRSTAPVTSAPSSPGGGLKLKNGGGGKKRSSVSGPAGGGATKEVHWKLLEGGVGISRVVGVVDQSGKAGFDHLLTLDLSPFTPPPNPKAPISSATYHLQPSQPPSSTIHLTLPERISNRLALAPSRVLQQTRAKWLAAFEQSFFHTVQAAGEGSLGRVVVIGHGQQQEREDWEALRFGEGGGKGGGAGGMPRSPSEQQRSFFASSSSSDPSASTNHYAYGSWSPSLGKSSGRHHRTVESEAEREKEERNWWGLRMRSVRADMISGEGLVGPGGGFGFGGIGGAVEGEKEGKLRAVLGGRGDRSSRSRFGR